MYRAKPGSASTKEFCLPRGRIVQLVQLAGNQHHSPGWFASSRGAESIRVQSSVVNPRPRKKRGDARSPTRKQDRTPLVVCPRPCAIVRTKQNKTLAAAAVAHMAAAVIISTLSQFSPSPAMRLRTCWCKHYPALLLRDESLIYQNSSTSNLTSRRKPGTYYNARLREGCGSLTFGCPIVAGLTAAGILTRLSIPSSNDRVILYDYEIRPPKPGS